MAIWSTQGLINLNVSVTQYAMRISPSVKKIFHSLLARPAQSVGVRMYPLLSSKTPKKGCPKYLNCIRRQGSNSGDLSSFPYHYSQVHSEPERKYLLV